MTTFSKSEIGTLRRCPRRYYFEYVLGRTPAQGPGIEAEWGTALHRGLEAWYTQVQHNTTVGCMAGVLSAALTRGVDAEGRPFGPPADPYARAALSAMLRAYVAVWGEHDMERYEVLHVELPFDLPVLTGTGRPSINRCWPDKAGRREGRMDAVVRERTLPCEECGKPSTCFGARGDDGPMALCDGCCDHMGHGCAPPSPRIWIIEHKSTGKPPAEERFYVGLEVELQPSLYFDAASLLGLAPAGVLYDVVRRPDFDDPKPAPKLTKSGAPRKAPTEECGTCEGRGRALILNGEHRPGLDVDPECPTCSGSGRVAKEVAYSNPRFGESPAAYEERVYQLATATPADWFGRRELTFEPWQIEESRADVHAAAAEVAWRARTGHWPRVGDRYACAARGMICPWLDVCGRRANVEDERLYPLKLKREKESEER